MTTTTAVSVDSDRTLVTVGAVTMAVADYQAFVARIARTCERLGYDVTADPEFASAVNLGVFTAMKRFTPGGPRSLRSLCTLFAVRFCEKVRLAFGVWQKQDQAGACQRSERYYGPTVQTPIPLTDFELLSFVAAHGRKRAARLLALRPEKLRLLLAEIELRVKAGRSDWEEAP